MMFPILHVAKSLSLSFNPIEKSKRVTPRSAIVCKPSEFLNQQNCKQIQLAKSQPSEEANSTY